MISDSFLYWKTLYYPVSSTSGSIVTQLKGSTYSPKLAVSHGHSIIMFFQPNDIKSFVDNNFKDQEGIKIKSTNSLKVVNEIYHRKALTEPSSPTSPDLVIFADLEKRISTYEYLVYSESRELVYEMFQGKKVIPAYIDRNKAINYQKVQAEQGRKLDRIGLDEKAFMNFTIEQGQKGYITLLEYF